MEKDDEIKSLKEYSVEALNRNQPEEKPLTVLEDACKGCVPSQIYVTDLCKGCVARPCESACKFGAINIHDGRAAVEIASIRNTSVMIGKDRTFDDYFANSVTNVGLKGEQAEMNMLSQNAIMDDLRNIRDSISGVNIDEELAEIIKFQHGYNAAAKFVSVIDSLLDTVINRLGV